MDVRMCEWEKMAGRLRKGGSRERKAGRERERERERERAHVGAT